MSTNDMNSDDRSPFDDAPVGPPPRDELDGLLRDWHAENAARAAAGRDHLLAALRADQRTHQSADQRADQSRDREGAAGRRPARTTIDDNPNAAAICETASQLDASRRHLAGRRHIFSQRIRPTLRRLVMNRYAPPAAAAIFLAVLAGLLAPTRMVQTARADWTLVPNGGRLDARDAAGRLIGACPLKHTDVDVAISGRFARVTLYQQYVNPYDEKIEAVYTFPLSHRGAVDRMTMTIGDRVVIGEVHEKEAARAIYREAKRVGHVASLLEQERPNIFTQSVANIEPGAEVIIEISYVEVLEDKDGLFSFEFPMVVAPRYIPGVPQWRAYFPAELSGRRGVIELAPSELALTQPGDTSEMGELDAASLRGLLNNAEAIDPPAAAYWSRMDAGGGPTVWYEFEAEYPDGSIDRGTLLTDGTGELDGRWFFADPFNVSPDGTGYAGDTDQVPDASRITPAPVRPEVRAGHNISIDVNIDTGGPGILDLHTPLHDVWATDRAFRGDGLASAVGITLQSADEIPNRDFVLTWRQTADTITEQVFAYTGEQGGFFTLILNPPQRVENSDIVPRELIFVLDTSGSMGGEPIAKAKQTMALAIDGLRPDDTFNLITFAGDTHVLWDAPRPADAANLAEAQAFLDSRQGSGGTEMMKAIHVALVQPARAEAPRDLTLRQLAALPADGREVSVYHIFRGAPLDEVTRAPAELELPVGGDRTIPATIQGWSIRTGQIDPDFGLPVRMTGRWVTYDGQSLFEIDLAEWTDRPETSPVRIVCFMTDGQVGNDMAILEAVKNNAATTRVFAFGIGQSTNRYLLDNMAKFGRGEVEYVLLDDSADEKVQRFAQRIQSPVLTDITLEFSEGLEIIEQVPAEIRDLHDVSPIIIHGRYETAGVGTLTVRGMSGAGPWERTIDIELPEFGDEAHDMLPVIWARARVEEIMNENLTAAQNGTFPPDRKAAVIALGERFQIMTQFTSFVAVERLRVTVGGQPRLIPVPVETPEGQTFQGGFGGEVMDLARNIYLGTQPFEVQAQLVDHFGVSDTRQLIQSAESIPALIAGHRFDEALAAVAEVEAIDGDTAWAAQMRQGIGQRRDQWESAQTAAAAENDELRQRTEDAIYRQIRERVNQAIDERNALMAQTAPADPDEVRGLDTLIDRAGQLLAEHGESVPDASPVAAEFENTLIVRRKLAETVPAINFDRATFEQVVDYYRDVSGLPLAVNWDALEQRGISREAEVSLRLQNVSLQKAVEVLLDHSGGGEVELAYEIDDGVITLSTKEDLERRVTTRVYNVEDLLHLIPDFTGREIDLGDIGQNQGGAGGGADVAAKRHEIESRERARIESGDRAKQRQVARLMRQARELRTEGRYADAAQVLHQVEAIDPNDLVASTMLETLEDMAVHSRGISARPARHATSQDLLVETEEALIPWNKDLLYRRNWPEISAKRLGRPAGQSPHAENPEPYDAPSDVLSSLAMTNTLKNLGLADESNGPVEVLYAYTDPDDAPTLSLLLSAGGLTHTGATGPPPPAPPPQARFSRAGARWHGFSTEAEAGVPQLSHIPSLAVDLWTLNRAGNQVPKQFVVPSTTAQPDPSQDTTAFYNFLARPNLSYSYQYQHDPNRVAAGTSAEPVFPVMADANPYVGLPVQAGTAVQLGDSPQLGEQFQTRRQYRLYSVHVGRDALGLPAPGGVSAGQGQRTAEIGAFGQGPGMPEGARFGGAWYQPDGQPVYDSYVRSAVTLDTAPDVNGAVAGAGSINSVAWFFRGTTYGMPEPGHTNREGAAFKLQFARAPELEKALNDLFRAEPQRLASAGGGTSAAATMDAATTVTSNEKSNELIVRADPNNLERIKSLIRQLDEPPPVLGDKSDACLVPGGPADAEEAVKREFNVAQPAGGQTATGAGVTPAALEAFRNRLAAAPIDIGNVGSDAIIVEASGEDLEELEAIIKGLDALKGPGPVLGDKSDACLVPGGPADAPKAATTEAKVTSAGAPASNAKPPVEPKVWADPQTGEIRSQGLSDELQAVLKELVCNITSGKSPMVHRVFQLEHADPEVAAGIIRGVFRHPPKDGDAAGASTQRVKVVADATSNSIAVDAPADRLPLLTQLLEQVDQPIASSDRVQIRLIKFENGRVAEIEPVLRKMVTDYVRDKALPSDAIEMNFAEDVNAVVVMADDAAMTFVTEAVAKLDVKPAAATAEQPEIQSPESKVDTSQSAIRNPQSPASPGSQSPALTGAPSSPVLVDRVALRIASLTVAGKFGEAKTLAEWLSHSATDYEIGGQMCAALGDEALTDDRRAEKVAELGRRAGQRLRAMAQNLAAMVRRLDERLLRLAMGLRGETLLDGLSVVDDAVLVSVLTADKGDETLAALKAAGLAIESVTGSANVVVGYVRLDSLGELAVVKGVRRVSAL